MILAGGAVVVSGGIKVGSLSLPSLIVLGDFKLAVWAAFAVPPSPK